MIWKNKKKPIVQEVPQPKPHIGDLRTVRAFAWARVLVNHGEDIVWLENYYRGEEYRQYYQIQPLGNGRPSVKRTGWCPFPEGNMSI